MSAETVKVPVLKLSHRNIRARYMVEKRHNPKFSHAVMAKQFGCDRQTAYKWCRVILDEGGKEVKDSQRCPLPVGTRKELVLAWLNDGVLIAAMRK